MPIQEASTSPVVRSAVYICDRCGTEPGSPITTDWGNVGCFSCVRRAFDLYCASEKIGVFGHGDVLATADHPFE